MVGIALHVEFSKRYNHNSINPLPEEALYSYLKIKMQNPRLEILSFFYNYDIL